MKVNLFLAETVTGEATLGGSSQPCLIYGKEELRKGILIEDN
jgi:hypothetical protein